MKKVSLPMLGMVVILCNPAFATDEIEQLRQQLDLLKQDYERRISNLEQRLEQAESQQKAAASNPATTISAEADPVQVVAEQPISTAIPANNSEENSFNPAISLILDGRYSYFSQDPDDYQLSGFMLGGEAGPGERGFSLGHSELIMSANADDKFYGRFTLALAEHEGEAEVEIEEAFFQTLGLDYGLQITGGRFYSDIGYLNSQHAHQWDFVDAPLIYRGLFGNQLLDDGIQLNWLAPTDVYLSFGSELFRGSRFPLSADAGNGIGAYTVYAKAGGDVGISNSWQAGVSYLDADTDGRSASGHGHSGTQDTHEPPAFSGDSKTWGVDLVWKWAPDGNRRQRNLQLQYEYYRRDDDGMLVEGDEFGTYQGEQSGWYAQAVYQFIPRWRFGLRYDALDSAAAGSDPDLIHEAGLDNESHKPSRWSLMTDWSNSEFSRFRLQYNRDVSSPVVDDQWMLQYLLSLGAHGAHKY